MKDEVCEICGSKRMEELEDRLKCLDCDSEKLPEQKNIKRIKKQIEKYPDSVDKKYKKMVELYDENIL